MGVVDKSWSERGRKFTDQLRSEHSVVPNARDVLHVEEELGTGAVASQLTSSGMRVLFRALDQERKAKLRDAQR